MSDKILLLSDSHRSTIVLRSVLNAPPEGLCCVIHLGDGDREISDLMAHVPQLAYLGVRGNCDPITSTAPTERTVSRAGVRLMLCHGHTYGVKSSLAPAATAAAREGASLLLFGHTHIPCDKTVATALGEVRCINPGSAACGEFAMLTLSEGSVVCEHMLYSSSSHSQK